MVDAHARLMRYFGYDHLPPGLQEISRPFGEVAQSLVEKAEDGLVTDPAELTVALRKLMEAKDAAVRSTLPRS